MDGRGPRSSYSDSSVSKQVGSRQIVINVMKAETDTDRCGMERDTLRSQKDEEFGERWKGEQ